MKFGRIVLQVNTNRLRESNFRFDVTRHTFKMAAMTSFHVEKLPSDKVHTHRPPAARCTSVYSS